MHKMFDVNVGRIIILQVVISECFKAEAVAEAACFWIHQNHGRLCLCILNSEKLESFWNTD